MKLSAYLKENNLTPQDFAPLIGVQWPAIYRYMSGKRVPTKPVLQKIFDVTKGAVTPNDIIGIPPETEAS